MTECYTIPSSFLQPPFYREGATLPHLNKAEVGETPPFYFDILYSLGVNHEQKWPWEEEESPSELFKRWEELRIVPERFFNERAPKEARPYMVRLTEYLICFLFWSEGKPVHFSASIPESVKMCRVAPVNVSERLAFVCESPDHYHAYIQLSSLFEEARKKQALFKIKQKNARPNA
jgi:hypothetical protein